ncbi:taurine ABC transporter permease, partial [Martelella sp. AMO21009]
PVAIVAKFFDTMQNGFTGTPLYVHILISAARVFSAFLLACLIGIPLGLAMGMSPMVRGIFDPPIEF